MSKGLKALEVIKNAPTVYVGLASDIYTRHPFECKAIEKELKALDIIKKKKVFVAWLKHDLSTYNNTCALYGLPRLKEEEFNLLKEVGLCLTQK